MAPLAESVAMASADTGLEPRHSRLKLGLKEGFVLFELVQLPPHGHVGLPSSALLPRLDLGGWPLLLRILSSWPRPWNWLDWNDAGICTKILVWTRRPASTASWNPIGWDIFEYLLHNCPLGQNASNRYKSKEYLSSNHLKVSKQRNILIHLIEHCLKRMVGTKIPLLWMHSRHLTLALWCMFSRKMCSTENTTKIVR